MLGSTGRNMIQTSEKIGQKENSNVFEMIKCYRSNYFGLVVFLILTDVHMGGLYQVCPRLVTTRLNRVWTGNMHLHEWRAAKTTSGIEPNRVHTPSFRVDLVINH